MEQERPRRSFESGSSADTDCRTPSPRRRSDRCVWHPSARRHLQLHFLRNSGAAYWSGRWATPKLLGRSERTSRRRWIGSERKLHRLEKENVDTKQEARKSRWLEMRIAVLRARLDYPTDEVLQQLEQRIEARKSLGRKKLRKFLDQLNTRLAQLESF